MKHSTRSAYQDSSLSRTPWITVHAHIIRTWTRTRDCRPMIWPKRRWLRLRSSTTLQCAIKCAQWMEPLKDLGVTTITLRDTGGTDHEAFDAVGVPGFQFIQDPLDYGSRTHHSNMDTYERLQADDLAQAALVEATFVYNAAMRDQMCAVDGALERFGRDDDYAARHRRHRP